ncbi:DUF4232 domain-containing protein [Pseudolysinimonas kribbensis]|uniref:DUF4232 domain-containing protein n=1 Tax=Pseudolysinimonas kribbensis TaxID=433641 RepID=UPI0031D3D889
MALLVGCSAVPIPSASTPVPTTTGSPTAVESPAPSTAPTSTGDPSGACDVRNLRMVYTPHPQDSGAGHSHFTLVFTNVGTDACTLDGYPGLVAIDADGGVLGDHAGQMTTGQDQPVLLAAEGGSADVEVLFTSAGVYGCTVVTAYGLRAYLPGTGDGIFAAAAIPVCERNVSLFSVGPFRTP